MCGLLFTNDPRIESREFCGALALMEHRGPDAEGIFEHDGARLGHRRLKILDLDDRANQPFFSRGGRYVLVFNGEIYNYRELARQHDLRPRTTCDSEIVVELFARQGAKMLDGLNGMFALVVWDLEARKLFVARDRLGVKPLYVRRRGPYVTLASEIAPLLALDDSVEPDPIGIRQYRKLRTFFNGRTCYAGIEMFPAAHYMENGSVVRYWELPEDEQPAASDDEIRELVTRSVQDRCLSDVPVGSYLSGGLDSTVVAALASKPHTWTVGFPDHNEFEWGALAARHLHSKHHEVIIRSGEFVELAREMIRQRREPLSVPNEVLLYKMTRDVKKENTVILSGEGADELFFGYDRIFRWAASAKVWDLSEFTRLYAYGSHDDPEIVEDALSPFMHLGTPIRIVAHFFQIAHLHGLLRRLDNSTMICSVEARVPFVDHHPLVERMAGVPFAARMQDGVVKSQLKRVFSDAVPRPILDRPKVGFPVPLETIPWNGSAGNAGPMDRWLEFNLSQLGWG